MAAQVMNRLDTSMMDSTRYLHTGTERDGLARLHHSHHWVARLYVRQDGMCCTQPLGQAAAHANAPSRPWSCHPC